MLVITEFTCSVGLMPSGAILIIATNLVEDEPSRFCDYDGRRLNEPYLVKDYPNLWINENGDISFAKDDTDSLRCTTLTLRGSRGLCVRLKPH